MNAGKIKIKLIPVAHELISNMKDFFQSNASDRSYLNEEPLREELFSIQQMARFGKTLAGTHVLSKTHCQDHLLTRLAENGQLLTEVRKLLADSIKKKYQITPAGEWLIDNFYLIEDHIRIAKTHFPEKYSEGLPQLDDKSGIAYTRIYDIVLKIISHTDGRIDIESLTSFIKAYQSITNLQLGELWAIPIMLRLALIENIRRVSSRVAIDRIDGNLADYWANLMLEKAEKEPKNLLLVVADMARSNPPIVSAFVSELTRQLRGKGPGLALTLNWIEQQLSENGLTANELINAENQKQAADQVSISNSIGSLRLLGAMDWRDFVETHSNVEQILREDNNGIYSAMNFSTRDRYRHVVENIAKNSQLSESEVARIAIQLMQKNEGAVNNDHRTAHVGYYLIGNGVRLTKKLAGMQIPFSQRFFPAFQKANLLTYLFFVFFITASITTGVLYFSIKSISNIWLLLPIIFLLLICTSQLAVTVINFISTLFIKPHLLPRMDFSQEIPPDFRTMVVIPVMLVNNEETEKLLESLEIRFLANRHDNLHFGLITDFTDAAFQILPGDAPMVNTVKAGIAALNVKYQRKNEDLFFLFHRPRKWNSQENVWMGYERKRGKLSDLNAVLRNKCADQFDLITGDQSVFPKIKYVITLDADTQLPLGAAWKLIGTMAHPLNQAWYNEKRKRVTKGYGVLQPRVAVGLPGATGSVYTRMHGNEPGVDPYTRASSDLYQDIFSEGSFIGKGIYEVDMFSKVLEGIFSENSILSHDLLEGCYLRSGLVSDVQLFENYPTTYRTDMARNSRWIRGDWQIFSWIFPVVPGKDKHWKRNPLSGLSRWKIIDNIRRSLVPIALTLLIILGWVAFSASLFWTITVSGIIILPIIISSLWDAVNKPKVVSLVNHLKNSARSIADIFKKTLFTLICLPYEAFSNASAIMKTLWRMIITRKKLLEWQVSSNKELKSSTTLTASYTAMWVQPLLAVSLSVYFAIFIPANLLIAGLVLFLWFLAPFVTWFISKPLSKQVALLSHEQHIFLRKLALKNWGFFEYFVAAENNWLPPDNYQEQPVAIKANRTSPTNIGLSLLANISALDFGYLTIARFIERTSNTLNTLHKMERYKGHFYNWYKIDSLETLQPKYISTVDSGNLIAHLMVLKQGLCSIPNQIIETQKHFEGLRDALLVFIDTLEEKDVHLFSSLKEKIDAICNQNIMTRNDEVEHINSFAEQFNDVIENLSIDPKSETYWRIEMLKNQLSDTKNFLELFLPFVLLKDAPEKFSEMGLMEDPSTLVGLLKACIEFQNKLALYPQENNNDSEISWLELFKNALSKSILNSEEYINTIASLAAKCDDFTNVEWDFLYNKTKNLLTIGYNVQEHQPDNGDYDLLASEARLCAFIGIGQGKLPEKSWFALSRLLTNVDGNPILLSWSGSMFEYLMPLLVMPTYENTLLDQTYKSAVEWQIRYGSKSDKPWGISESGYNMINANTEYQYRAFGAPGLGLKRGLEEDSVIAPYASALALMISPIKACENLQLLDKKGTAGRYGFYEAIDYTASRLQRGQNKAIVYSFMAHHQGMTLLSLAYLLLDKPMQKLFEAEAQFKAILLLLQERIPKATTFHSHTTDIADTSYVAVGAENRIINTPDTILPEVQLLSNGRYHVMLTNAGGGYSRWKDLAVTRWREDATCDNWGTFCYIQDAASGEYWSTTHQPSLKKGDQYEAAFSQGRVDFHTINNEIETRTEIVVSPEDDIEMRRIKITNNSGTRKTITVTTYSEVVLAPAASDLSQPAFSNLFIQTEILPVQHALLCSRRPRSIGEKSPCMFHLLSMDGKHSEEISYETDRLKFIGRGNSSINPQAMKSNGPLSGMQGAVLDPIVAIRYKITLDPEEKIILDMVTGMAETREACIGLINKYQDNKPHKDRVFEMAWTHSQVVLRQINASETDAQLYGQLASSILFANASLRADPAIQINNHRQQSGLWGYSISGDLPIVLLKITKQANMQLVKQMVQAHAYWKLKGLTVDLVIWNEEHNGYRQVFQDEIEALIPIESKDRPGGIFVRAADQISNEDRILFESVARVNISDTDGTLAEQVKRKRLSRAIIPNITIQPKYNPSLKSIQLPEDLQFFNGLGAFSADGKEYIVGIDKQHATPAPWVNVIANPEFGTVVSESGSAYTWTENAHELRLTPWNNDPICDTGGEVFYIRDEETGRFWSTTLLPAGGELLYVTHHGFGYSIFKHLEDGIFSEMLVYVDMEMAVKFNVLKIHNKSGRPRKLSVTGYIEWVLGDNRTKTAMHVHTEVDPDSGALFAKNQYNTEFSKRVAFFDVDYLKKSFTGDRTEFIGRNGNLKSPDAMLRVKLSGRTGLSLDPCAAIQVPFDVGVGEEQEIIFRLGVGKNSREASNIAKQFRGSEAAQASFEKVKKHWKNITGALQVETPDAALNIITNGWLTYQTLSSRLWGRTGFYQSGGAFGFRDQLQDVMSLLHTAPELARKQILLCASRQFKEGDVQHWWHPPVGRGVRTRIADDLLWLPLVTSIYVSQTGDVDVLREPVNFLEGRLLNADEESYFDLPLISDTVATIYEHCVKAIRHRFNYGVHGLPLIGTGDWNDGFDKVGDEGKGESVWMGFFMYEILQQFSKMATLFGDAAFAEECKQEAQKIEENIDKHAWDGDWYKRAWFDNGTPLGSVENEECKIDSIVQSWSVLSGAGDIKRATTAMASAYKNLVNRDAGIIQLLEPPFDKSNLNPGYIKGYVPGIRENGGQYTHAAIWLIMAFAKMGDNKKVWELLTLTNPVNHTHTPEELALYKVEPYVIAADVYGGKQHAGRGGWTWYTGSASWMYRLITESFLGIQRTGNKLKFTPCIPASWNSYKIQYRYMTTLYNIAITQNKAEGEMMITVDGQEQVDKIIHLVDDNADHQVEMVLYSLAISLPTSLLQEHG